MMTNKKKAFYFILPLALLIVSSCNNPKEQKKEHPEPVKEVKPPTQIITTKKAQTLFDDYSKRRATLIKDFEDNEVDPNSSFDVARYGYYDLKTLKNYIAFIEQEAKKANVEITNVRFYFGNYPKDSKYKHPRQNTFFIAPTTTVDGKDYPFSVITDGKTYKPKILKDNFLLQPSKQSTTEEASIFPKISFFNDDEEQSLILNHSNMVPPPYED
ncbi:hypothetical protein IZU89_11900 [Cellulophaga lytica]|uniref:hypothetical protein n=1 Tax=Cellulophaga lytica TaxID=979 RepID=UPI0032E52EE9